MNQTFQKFKEMSLFITLNMDITIFQLCDDMLNLSLLLPPKFW